MIDVQSPVRAAYYTALQGFLNALNDEGLMVPVNVYDNVPKHASTPYVAFREQTATYSAIAQGCGAYDTTILLEIVTHFQGEDGGRAQADSIANQILQRIPDGLPEDISFTSVQLDYSPPVEATGINKVYRRLIRFRNNIYS